jgi:hypothetical protein
MSFSDNESDGEYEERVATPPLLSLSYDDLNYENINNYIDTIVTDKNKFLIQCVSIITITKKNNYKTVSLMVTIKSKIEYISLLVYDDTYDTYSLRNDYMNEIECAIGNIVVDVCKNFGL